MDKTQPLLSRAQTDPKTHWHTTDIFATDIQWQEAYQDALQKIPTLSKCKGVLGKSAQSLYDCLHSYDALSLAIEKLYVYAFLRFHEDSANAFFQGLSEQAESLMIRFSTASAFIIPEILEVSPKKLLEFQKTIPQLTVYNHFFENIQRQRQHTLSPAEEALLAKAAELSQAPQNIFTMLNEADIKFPMVKNHNGEMVELSKARYTTFLENKDRDVRKAAFDALYETYEKQKNTLAAAYGASVKADVFFAQARRYHSALDAALDDDNIPTAVYHNLLDTIHQYLPLMHRYIQLRKKRLGVSELHMYDLYVPLAADITDKISYEQAKETVVKALGVMGDKYIQALKKGLSGGWIDVYENQGKRSGAYSWGIYGVHPYVLLNHNDTTHSMFTLAHEMGHALHSYFTWERQPYLYAGHKIFVAEVASTVNETLLIKYLLENTEDKNKKCYFINHFLEQFRGTFFRQSMFAEFEKLTHAMAEQGEPLTCETLNETYRKLNEQYFGQDMVIDEHIQIEWARIPHFYNAFYVYQYATGYAAAIALSKKILEEGQPAIDAYMDFLSKGNSEYSIDLLKGAGVDMTTTKPLEEAMAYFEELLDEMERLMVE